MYANDERISTIDENPEWFICNPHKHSAVYLKTAFSSLFKTAQNIEFIDNQ